MKTSANGTKNGNYDEYHLEWLKDPENAAAFLNAVIEDSDREAFLLALKDVARAQGGIIDAENN